MKYSRSWGYHLEIEQVVSDLKLQEQAERDMRIGADELGVQLMAGEELQKFVFEMESIYDHPTSA